MSARMLVFVLVALRAVNPVSRAAESNVVTLVAPGSIWRYWDYKDAPSASWKVSAFADTGWKSGPAQFGYLEGDEATWLNSGESFSLITHYFRQKFYVGRAGDFTNVLAQVLRDDGVVVYINGQEVVRMNMPDGEVNHFTYASSRVTGTNENFYFSTNFSAAVLLDGENTIAVELHQTAVPGDADASFDMSLIATRSPRPGDLPRLAAAHNSQRITVQWEESDVLLEQLVLPGGSWETLTNAISPHEIPLPTDSRLFRLRRK
jgi:hypothetical protein